MSGADWVLFAPMRVEARTLRQGLPPGAPLRRTGRGPARATRVGAGCAGTGALAVAGIGGGLSSRLRTGDVVVATEVRRAGVIGGAPVPCPAAPMIAEALRRRGLTVHLGPVVTSRNLVDGRVRDRLAATGALAVDTESAALLADAAGRPTACVRVVADVPPHPLYRPATLHRVVAALRVLPQIGPALLEWAAATTARQVLLAAPRSVCAGVERAISLVEQTRQAALREVPAVADVVLVLGSVNSSNSRRLVEVTERGGIPAYLVDDVDEVDLRWLAGVRTIGVTAGAWAPPRLVDRTVAALAGLGADAVRGYTTRIEDLHLTLPKEIRTP